MTTSTVCGRHITVTSSTWPNRAGNIQCICSVYALLKKSNLWSHATFIYHVTKCACSCVCVRVFPYITDIPYRHNYHFNNTPWSQLFLSLSLSLSIYIYIYIYIYKTRRRRHISTPVLKGQLDVIWGSGPFSRRADHRCNDLSIPGIVDPGMT